MKFSLKIENLHKIFNEGETSEVYALRDINIEFNNSELALVVGHNGSGKSTLLNIIDGRIMQTKGKISINNSSIDSLRIHSRSKYFYRLFQNSWNGVIPLASIKENLALAYNRNNGYRLFKNLNSISNESLFSDTLEEFNVDLSNNLNKKVFTLSPGERQAIVLALLKLQKDKGPQILLADEPTASLDPKLKEKSISLINELVNDGWLCIIVTHDDQLISKHKGQLIELDHGIISEGNDNYFSI